MSGSRGLCPFCKGEIEVPKVTVHISADRIQQSLVPTIEKPVAPVVAAPLVIRTAKSGREQAIPPIGTEAPTVATPKLAEATISVQQPIQAFDTNETISLWIASVGLGLLCLSPFLPWVRLGAGGFSGLAGDGRILLGLSVLAVITFVLALTIRWQINWVLLTVEFWGVFVAFWMCSLLWQLSRMTTESDGALAKMFSTMLISPGSGLYVGLIGGMAVAASLVFFISSRSRLTSSTNVFAILQSVTVAVAALVALVVVPAGFNNSIANGGTQKRGLGNTIEPKENVIEAKLGQQFDLGNLKITPDRFDLVVLQERPVFGDPKPRKTKSFVLTISARNTSTGQVFTPYTKMEVRDNFGNVCPDPTDNKLFSSSVFIAGDEMFKDLRPGETASVKVAFDPQVENAIEYTCKLTTKTSNEPKLDEWQLKFTPNTSRTNSRSGAETTQ
jgi:hypothetical protein